MKSKLELMDETIAHWEENVNGPPFNITEEYCPLCKIYAGNDCKGCPVSEFVNDTSCSGTPWGKVYYSILDKESDSVIKLRCREELEFLKEVKEWVIENDY